MRNFTLKVLLPAILLFGFTGPVPWPCVPGLPCALNIAR